MEDSTRYKSIVAIAIIIVACIGLLSWIIPALNKEKPGAQNNCITATETWNNIGKNTCVVFYPRKFARSGGYYFIDEKEDYKNGFVVFVGKKNLISWEGFLTRFDVGRVLEVHGKIELYEGHPEIKVYNLDNIIVK